MSDGNSTFSIKLSFTDDSDRDAALAEWSSRKVLEGVGCDLQRMGRSRLGFAASESMLNLSLSFVPGVPASTVANWLWETVAKHGQRKFAINSKSIASVEELQRWIVQYRPGGDDEPDDVGQGLHLQRLWLPQFKNLRELDIRFSAYGSPAYEGETLKRFRSQALIGQNGMGKSNLIEAIITIFRDVDLDRDAAFDYELSYSIRGHFVKLLAKTGEQKRPYVWVDGRQQSQGYLLKNKELLPSHIFAYYSGRNERIEELFQEHQRRFNRRQEITSEETLPERFLTQLTGSEADIRAVEALKRREDNKMLNQFGDDRLRRLFYCRGGHSQLVLLACLLSDDPVFKKVLNNLNIESLESALFVLKEPHRLREKRRNQKFDDNDLNEGDPRFWYARGNVVSEFLDKLWQVAWAPIEQEATKQIDFRGRTEKQNQLNLFVPSQEKLKQLGELLGGRDSFFRYAEGAYIGDLIEEVRITVKKSDGYGGKVSFTQLSEGELQMLTVLGLMRITRDDHCLFLLDEPDTHLNPIWKLRYFDDIEGVLGDMHDNTGFGNGGFGIGPFGTTSGQSQIFITTHDPLMVGSLKREQVHIMRRDGERTVVDVPDEHPQGMGVSGLLKSDLFGLASTLDQRTLEDLQRRNELIAKEAKSGLTEKEQDELERLRQYLEQLGFAREFRDPMYQLFVQKMYEVRSQPLAQLLTPEQLQEQEALARMIATRLVIQQRGNELAEMVGKIGLLPSELRATQVKLLPREIGGAKDTGEAGEVES